MFFLQNNSALLYRNLTDIISNFSDHINRHLILLGEIIIFIGVAFILFYVDFLGTIIVLSSVSVVSLIIYFSTIKRVSFLGKERNIISGELNKHLLQGIASAKDVKILDREDDLIYQVDKHIFKLTRLNQVIQFINGLPRFSFEVLIVFVFVVLILMMLGAKRETIDIIQYLGRICSCFL